MEHKTTRQLLRENAERERKHNIEMKDGTVFIAMDFCATGVKAGVFTHRQAQKPLMHEFVNYTELFGNYVDEEARLVTLDRFLRDYTRELPSGTPCLVSITSQQMFSRMVALPPVVDEPERIAQIVDFEARQNVPYPMDEVYFDWVMLKPSSRDFGGQYNVLFCVAKKDTIDVPVEAIQKAGLRPIVVTNSGTEGTNALCLSLANGFAGSEFWRDHQCAAILDIGARSTNLAMVDMEDARVMTRCIPIAGYSISQQISRELGLGFIEADELKKRPGVCVVGVREKKESEPEPHQEEDHRDLASRLSFMGGLRPNSREMQRALRLRREDPYREESNDDSSCQILDYVQGEGQSEAHFECSKIVRNVMSRLHGEINRSISVYRAHNHGPRPEHLFITGGGSLLPGTVEFFHEKLRMGVSRFEPACLVELSREMRVKYGDSMEKIAPYITSVVSLANRPSNPYPGPFPFNLTTYKPRVRIQSIGKLSGVFMDLLGKCIPGGHRAEVPPVEMDQPPADFFMDCPDCEGPGECKTCGGKAYLTATEAKQLIAQRT